MIATAETLITAREGDTPGRGLARLRDGRIVEVSNLFHHAVLSGSKLMVVDHESGWLLVSVPQP